MPDFSSIAPSSMVLAPKAPLFNCEIKSLLAVQEIELVRVKRLFHRIDDDIHLVVGIDLGNLVTSTHPSTVTLCQV